MFLTNTLEVYLDKEIFGQGTRGNSSVNPQASVVLKEVVRTVVLQKVVEDIRLLGNGIDKQPLQDFSHELFNLFGTIRLIQQCSLL